MSEAIPIKRALLCVLVGLVIEMFCIHDLTPASFIAFALLSVPLVLAGAAIYLVTVWRVLRRTRGL